MADPRLTNEAVTANDELFDAAIRHQVGIRRFSSGEVKRILEILEKADAELVLKLRKKLARFAGTPGGPPDFTTKRIRDMITDLMKSRKELMRRLEADVTAGMLDLGKIEVGFEERMIKAAVPFEITLGAVAGDVLKTALVKRPFEGRLLKQWFDSLESADQAKLIEAIQLGLAQGESTQDIVRRVAGTRAKGFSDGALAITRRNAEAVVRTAVNHVSNAARETVWDANSDIIAALRWTSVLDGRTSAICRGRDGNLAPVADKPLPSGSIPLKPPSARPPAHIRCRSVMTAVLDGEEILGRRPFVIDTRTPERRRVDFRRMARQQGRPIQDIRREWAAKNIGTVPADVNYQEWLGRQSAGFQNEVLGKTKGRLFRKGDLKLTEYTDRAGNELTLKQLADTKPEAFTKAGLDPDDF